MLENCCNKLEEGRAYTTMAHILKEHREYVESIDYLERSKSCLKELTGRKSEKIMAENTELEKVLNAELSTKSGKTHKSN